MSASRKNYLANVMNLAWTFVRKNGLTMSDAMKLAWKNIKLKTAMATKIVKFTFEKVNGEIRQAFGTLAEEMMPMIKGTGRRPSDTVQVYYDTEKGEFRSFKKVNLINIY